jgi:hypothetical protein
MTGQDAEADASVRVEALLDEFHAAAAAADEDRYLACLAPRGVFLGTAPGERWARDDFRTFLHRFFSQGKGWTYVPEGRSVAIASDGTTAWFDETLANDWFGECRGTGVVRLHEGEWKIEQYSLSFPIPDELVAGVVAKIRDTAEP